MLNYMRDEEGVTLLEIILATALIAIALSSLSGAFTAGILSGTHVGYVTTALYLAQEKLEEIKNLPYADIQSEVRTVVPGFPRFYRKVKVSNYQPDLKQVKVEVIWMKGKPGNPDLPVAAAGKGETVELDTLIASY